MRYGVTCGLLLLAATHSTAQVPRHTGFVDADERAFVIEEVTKMLDSYYLFSERAQQMEQAIRDRRAAGAYDRLTRADQFVRALTRDLQEASGDKHLAVHFSLEPLPAELPTSPPAVPIQPQPVSEAQKELLGAFWRNESCSFANAAVLLGNVGYLKFNAFPSPRVCGETTAAAMTLLADCHALIIDLRDNIGGDPAMVSFVSSYLFDAPVHLNDMHQARTNATVQSWTTAVVPGRQFIRKPVFVLISPRTFSAAEEFAYNLKMLGRATIVGERSGGGAHAALSLRIDSHFHVSIPFARSINPISHSNWEGKGVEPDVGVREDVAVHAAHRAALEGVLKQALSATHREAVRRHIDALTAILQSKG
jgi:hypothetical protein